MSVEVQRGTAMTHDRRSGTGVERAVLVADPGCLLSYVSVPSTSAFCMVRDYERGATIAVGAGCGAATVSGCGAAAIAGCEVVTSLGVVLGATAVVDRGVRYAGVPSPISSPSSPVAGCPAPAYGGVSPPRREPLPMTIPHFRR